MSETSRGSALPTLALLGVTATWGSTFFLIKDLLAEVSVLDFLSIRFAIAAFALLAVAPRAMQRLTREEVRNGIALGLVYGVAQVLQTLGLSQTPATVSGFVTGMYVVATPVLAAFVFREHIGRLVWIAVVVAAVGLGFLSLQGLSVSPGVMVIFCSALLYAVHIIGLGRWSTGESAFGLAVVQMVVIAAVCTLVSAPNGIGAPDTVGGWSSLVYMAIVAGALAILAQTWAQAHLAPTRAAIIMTMEPVWAAFFAVLFGGESLTGRMLVGGGFVLSAMYLVELAPRRKVGAEVTHLTV
ncbi:MAG: DMT family transporter [Propionibacteriales bacterium]|nr:DMT family transporter [Propionibacteriales bacterium]